MLDTIDSVISELGGPSEVQKLTGVGAPGQSNWKARGAIPSDLFFILDEALHRRGKRADRKLFGFKTAAACAR